MTVKYFLEGVIWVPLMHVLTKTFRKIFSKKILKACPLSRETIVLQVENEMFQKLWKWPSNIANILSNSKSIITQIEEKICP